ncbi:MAG: SRPBCC family protein [Proteobacteria bacterium]|nr:SRPBCC family protein [Pseudomonadota bacterium]
MPEALTATMPNDTEIVVTRTFNAPRQLVWDAHTKPELVQRWLLGPDGWTMPICEVDFRVGGKYRYGWANPSNGRAFEMGGVFKEIAPIERIVHSERFGETEALVTMVLAETRGRTTMTLTIRYDSKQTRDAAFGTGMTTGMERSYERLDEMAAEAA